MPHTPDSGITRGNVNVGVVKEGVHNVQGGSVGFAFDFGIPGAMSGTSLSVSNSGAAMNVRGGTGGGFSAGVEFCYTSKCVPE